MKWYLKVFKQYADFTGRARRQEYWMFVLFNFIAIIVTAFLDGLIYAIAGEGIPIGSITSLYSIFVLIPSLAVTARRLHDTGRSAWWLLMILTLTIGAIWLFVLTLLDSKPGANRFGLNPKETSCFREKDRTKSAAVLLITAASIWIATSITNTLIAICKYEHYQFEVAINCLLYLTPIAMLVVGALLLSKNSKKQFAAILLVAAAAIRLVIQIKSFIDADAIFTDMLIFNISAVFELLFIAIPIVLIVFGLSMLRSNNAPIIHPKAAANTLLVVGYFWILKIIYQHIILPILAVKLFGFQYDSISSLLSLAMITVPVAFIALAYALKQNKEKIPVEDEIVIEHKMLYEKNRSPIRIGFAVVSICVGVLLFISSIGMFSNKEIGAFGLIPLIISLFLWITGICGLVVRRKQADERLLKRTKTLTLVAFILSCSILAFVIIMPIMIEVFG